MGRAAKPALALRGEGALKFAAVKKLLIVRCFLPLISGAGEALPDPLMIRDGTPIETPQQWEEMRQPELLRLFGENMFGKAPLERPEDLAFAVVDEDDGFMGGAATRRLVDVRFSGKDGGEGRIRAIVFSPNNRDGPVPGFLLICHRDAENIDPLREHWEDFGPAEEIVARGYAAVAFQVDDVDPDEHDGFRNGVHGLLDPWAPEKRPDEAWGTLAAWAWGASRVMDYLEADSDLDHEKFPVIGHSRGGKTALWAGARDERFALAISNNSSANGAALARNRKGEKIAFANRRFPHWFARSYRQYNHDLAALPFDQHELIALMALRRVYVASAAQDDWADPEGEFLSSLHASPVGELFGEEGLPVSERPPLDEPVQGGHLGYHIRSGGHDMTGRDWAWSMDYTDRHWK